jgi:hypothetical protein
MCCCCTQFYPVIIETRTTCETCIHSYFLFNYRPNVQLARSMAGQTNVSFTDHIRKQEQRALTDYNLSVDRSIVYGWFTKVSEALFGQLIAL